MYPMEKTRRHMYSIRQNIKWSLSHALLYSFIVFKYVVLSLRKDKYILGRIGLYFWEFFFILLSEKSRGSSESAWLC